VDDEAAAATTVVADDDQVEAVLVRVCNQIVRGPVAFDRRR